MSDELEKYSSGRGESVITGPKPDILVWKMTGHLDKVTGERFLGVLNRVAPTVKHLYAFVDWAEMTGYDSAVRAMFTQWVATNRSKMTVHILVGSKIVSMGVSVANLALGGSLIGYTSHSMFDAALRSAKMGLSGVFKK
jgi:hypothetical protein